MGRVYDDRTGEGIRTKVTALNTQGVDLYGYGAFSDSAGLYELRVPSGEWDPVSEWGARGEPGSPDALVTLFRSDAPCQTPRPMISLNDGEILYFDFVLRAFCDVPSGKWYFKSVEAVAAAGIADGRPDRSYGPLDGVSRAEMAAFLVKALGETPTTPTAAPFPDVAVSKWHAGYIDRLKQLGYVTGRPDGTYGPDDTVTRAEAAAFLIKALGETPTTPTADPFTDVPSNTWYAGYVDRLKELGLTTGRPDGTYGPLDTVNRAEMAAFLERAFIP